MLMQFHAKCKKADCGGHLVIRMRSSGPDDNGNREFVGCSTRRAFKLLWKNLFWVIWAITGVHVRYKAIHRNGNLIGNLLDAEPAQAQGLGDLLAEQVRLETDDIILTENDGVFINDIFTSWEKMTPGQLSDYLTELIIRLCCTHYSRLVSFLLPM